MRSNQQVVGSSPTAGSSFRENIDSDITDNQWHLAGQQVDNSACWQSAAG
jgi:hypothetical protein